MNGFALRFYMHESQKHHGVLLYEWLLEQAKKEGIQGGSAFKTIVGYGRHRVMHEDRFFELAGQNIVLVEFILDGAETEHILEIVKQNGAQLFWAKFPAEFGIVGEDR